MRHRRFGRTGVDVPVVGLGTWNMEKDDEAKVIAAIEAGIEAGATHVDTAEMYGRGEAERIVGKAIDGRRDELFVVSKVLPSNASSQGMFDACRRSLDRLRIDSLDCYLLHWLGSHPLKETIAAFEKLESKGRIRSWGVSNFDENALATALEIAGPDRIACNQVLYHLQERSIEHKVIPFCQQNDIPVVAYSPFGSGDFPDPESRQGKLLEEIANELGVSPRQAALAFLLRHDGMFLIPKSSDPDHARENAEAGDLELSQSQIDRIDEAFPRGEWTGGVPTL